MDITYASSKYIRRWGCSGCGATFRRTQKVTPLFSRDAIALIQWE